MITKVFVINFGLRQFVLVKRQPICEDNQIAHVNVVKNKHTHVTMRLDHVLNNKHIAKSLCDHFKERKYSF